MLVEDLAKMRDKVKNGELDVSQIPVLVKLLDAAIERLSEGEE